MPNPFPENIEIREMRQEDIPSAADMLITSPDDGTLYPFPQYLQDSKNLSSPYIKWLRSVLRDQTTLTRIVAIPQQYGRKCRVVGYSSWQRTLADPKNPGLTVCRNWRKATWGDGMYQVC